MNKLPRDIILIISKMHPLIIPPFTNKTLRRAVKDYLAGGDRKKRIVEKYGECLPRAKKGGVYAYVG